MTTLYGTLITLQIAVLDIDGCGGESISLRDEQLNLSIHPFLRALEIRVQLFRVTPMTTFQLCVRDISEPEPHSRISGPPALDPCYPSLCFQESVRKE